MIHSKIVENGKNFSLLFDHFNLCEAIFSEEGHDGGGYDWMSVISYVVETEHSQLIDRVNYDPESSMFVAYGDDKDALEEVGKLIGALIADQDRLRAVIKAVPEGYWD